MIPLLHSEPLPEYMELLDELKLPKIRTSDYIVGIWILNKGKLAPLPVPPASQPVFATASTNVPTYPTPVTQLPSVPPAPPSGLSMPPAIVAEVASLTPEQIQSVLQTLRFSQAQPPVQPPPHMNPMHPPQPQMGTTPSMPPQLWGSQPPSAAAFPKFPPQPPVGAYQSPPHGSMRSLASPHSQPLATSQYERQDYSHEFRGSSYDGERGDQSWRGNNNRGGRGGRGRGARGDGFDPTARRPVDSGWPRRPRNEGPAGGPSW